MDFLAAAIQRNSKRAQLQSDERLVAGEGFMLNVLTVLQQLSIKIKLDKVLCPSSLLSQFFVCKNLD